MTVGLRGGTVRRSSSAAGADQPTSASKPFHLTAARRTAWLLPFLLAACATIAPPPAEPPVPPLQWQAPLPHDGDLTDLSRWWAAQGDPLMVTLIESAQAASPTLASAASRMAQARAARAVAGAALVPRLDGTASASRARTSPLIPQGTTVQGGMQASWEVDLFGSLSAARAAADARLEGSAAQWHDARVSVAADTANLYLNFRICERQLRLVQSDAESRAESLRLTQLAADAGFQPPAAAALSRAGAAEGRARVTQQRAECDLTVKALVALTDIAEPRLREQLGQTDGPGEFAPVQITALPAKLLEQRPDLFAAEREVAAAAADLGSAQAQRYPRLTLQGAVGRLRFDGGGLNTEITTWSVGPVALSVPLFDGGRINANIDAARARYFEAAALFRARARQAVREVEEALVTLASTAERWDDAKIAAEGQRSFLGAAKERYRGGLSSLFELEETRRNALAAELALLALERDRQAAWIALYRAAGGGWDREPTAILEAPQAAAN
ncbi:MAG: efflux transporter outer membrane subunit [Burkholderiales bacterium]